MKRASSQPILKYFEENDHEEEKEDSEEITHKVVGEEDDDDDDDDDDNDYFVDDEEEMEDITEKLRRIVLQKQEPTKRGEELSCKKYSQWRQERKTRAARLEKELKARWTLEDLIDEQLDHYSRAMVPSRPRDVAQLLMPKWAPPHELASVAWFGDWRPSAILDLLRALASCSSSFSPFLLDLGGAQRRLLQLIQEVRIEETVIDEEMAEIQATCILHLPFATMNRRLGCAALTRVRSELRKIDQVIAKAQQLRFKALEFVVKKVLSRTDAAEFLVAFAGIQDSIHQFAADQRFRKGPIRTQSKNQNQSWEGKIHSPIREQKS